METILLNNGKTLPLEGFGVFQIADQTLCQQAVLEALQEGYRLIDTAASYFNEEAVGRALRTSGLPRDEVFVTTKVWVQDFGEVKTREAVLRSLEKLGLEYIDMVLLHQQMGGLLRRLAGPGGSGSGGNHRHHRGVQLLSRPVG